ncbi:unnamed protein product, partial [Rotaria sp. Silwood1]
MGKLMLKMAKFDKAEEIYTTLLTTVSEDDPKELARVNFQLGSINAAK